MTDKENTDRIKQWVRRVKFDYGMNTPNLAIDFFTGPEPSHLHGGWATNPQSLRVNRESWQILTVCVFKGMIRCIVALPLAIRTSW